MQRNNSGQIEFFLECIFDNVPYILGKTIISEPTAKAKIKEGNWKWIDKKEATYRKFKIKRLRKLISFFGITGFRVEKYSFVKSFRKQINIVPLISFRIYSDRPYEIL